MYSGDTSQHAWSEALQYLELFFDQLDGVKPETDLESAMTRLSAEARMLVWEKLLEGGPVKDRGQRTRELAFHILRDGKGTLNDLMLDLEGMSPEGRAHAFAILTSHPGYTHKGSRRSQLPGPTIGADGSLAFPDLNAAPTGYQVMVDTVRGLLDEDWASAIQGIEDSKRCAGNGDWRGAASAIARPIAVLKERSQSGSVADRHDLAAAYIHLETYLGNSGRRYAGQNAIERSLQLLWELRNTANDDDIELDTARALASQATRFAESGDMAEAVRGQSAAVTLIEGLADKDFAGFGAALAEHLSQLALLQRYAGDPRSAASTIVNALDAYKRLASLGVRVDPAYVDLARAEQTQIRTALASSGGW